MTLAEQKSQLQAQIDGFFAKPNMTASERTQCNVLLSKMADLRATEERQARLDKVMHETRYEREENQPEYRTAKLEGAFNYYLRTGNDSELRTYTPLSSAGVPIPQGFAAAYGERLKSFSGIREAGATVITTTNADPLKNPFSDDTANVGERLNENDLVSLANPTFSATLFGAFRYDSKGLQYSAQLLQDSGIDVAVFLQRILARRIGRITNTEFTLGAAGGPTGVIPSITNIKTGNSSSSLSLSDLLQLQAIDAGYLDGAVYMFSPATERALKAVVDSNGHRVFPEMNNKMLLGYPYVLNVDMPAPATTVKSVAFGSFRNGVVIREVTPQLLISNQRYGEFFKLYASLRHDQDCQVVDANALSILQHP